MVYYANVDNYKLTLVKYTTRNISNARVTVNNKLIQK